MSRRGEIYFIREGAVPAQELGSTMFGACCSNCANGLSCDSSFSQSNTTLSGSPYMGVGSRTGNDIATYGQAAASTWASAQVKNAAAYALVEGAGLSGVSLLSSAASTFNVYLFVIAVVFVIFELFGAKSKSPEEIFDEIGGSFNDYAGDFLGNMPGVDLPDIDLPDIDLDLIDFPPTGAGPSNLPGLELPDLSVPEMELPTEDEVIKAVEEVDYELLAKNWQCMKNPVDLLIGTIQKKALCQRKVVRPDGSTGWEYYMEDGSIVAGNKSLMGMGWVGLGMGAAGLALLAIGTKEA